MVTPSANHCPPLALDALLAPLDARQPAGVFDEEDGTFQGIDSEMIKLGSLQEARIDWNFVDEAARQYLGGQCKHFRIAAHLAVARLRTRSWRGWAEAAGLLAGMVARYWESGYPKPGATGFAGKRRLVAQQLERLGEALGTLAADSFAEAYCKAGQQALDQLQDCAPQAGLDVPGLTRLEGQLRQQAEATRAPELAEGRLDLPPPPGAPVTEAFFNPAALATGNEREGRRSLLAVAELINQQDPYDPTGYLLRRFSLWTHLSTAPPARKDARTELMAVSADTAEAYWEAMHANAVDPVLLQRVERSVTSSPYWLRGSYLAAGIARRLEMPRVAEAIRQATERFLTRLPGLARLQFADGRPFVDGDTQAWISGAEASPAASGGGREYPALRDELRALLETEGVESMLRRLEAMQQDAGDLRHRCHVMAIAAALFDLRGLSWLADGLYARAHLAMRGASAPEWEPDLFNLLERQAPAAQKRQD